MSTYLRRTGATLGILALAAFGLADTSTAAAQANHPHHQGVQHFLGLQTDTAEDATPTIIATGPIHTQGSDTVIDDTHDVFVFPDGSVDVTHKPKHHHDSFDPATCLGRFNERGRCWITGGTGAYAHVSGHGHYTVTAVSVGCAENTPPSVFMLTIKAKGPIRF